MFKRLARLICIALCASCVFDLAWTVFWNGYERIYGIQNPVMRSELEELASSKSGDEVLLTISLACVVSFVCWRGLKVLPRALVYLYGLLLMAIICTSGIFFIVVTSPPILASRSPALLTIPVGIVTVSIYYLCAEVIADMKQFMNDKGLN